MCLARILEFLRESKAHRSDSAPGSLATRGSKSYGTIAEFSPNTKPQNHKTTEHTEQQPFFFRVLRGVP
jgi:hypothetical protein